MRPFLGSLLLGAEEHGAEACTILFGSATFHTYRAAAAYSGLGSLHGIFGGSHWYTLAPQGEGELRAWSLTVRLQASRIREGFDRAVASLGSFYKRGVLF